MLGLAGREVLDDIEPLGGGAQVGIRELAAVGYGEVRPRHLQHNHAHFGIARRDLGGGEVAGRYVVVVPETERNHLAPREEFPHLRREYAEVRARVRGGLRPGVSRENIQHAHAKRAVLVLLAPHARGQIHQRRERAVCAADCPHAHMLLRIQRYRLPHEPDRRGHIARLLYGGFKPRAAGIVNGIVVAPQPAVFYIDGFGEVGRHDNQPVVGDIVHILGDFGYGAARPPHIARLLKELYGHILALARHRICDAHRLRLHRQVLDLQPLVQERIRVAIDPQRQVVLHAVAYLHKPIGEPIAKPVAVQHGQRRVYVALELDEALAVVAHAAVADALKLNAKALLECGRQRREVVAV